MAHNSEYTKIFTSDGEGLAVREVARCLGLSIGDLSKLCCSSKINKDAKYKPLSGFSTRELSEEQRMSKNYGYEYMPYYRTIQALADDLWANSYTHAENYDASKEAWGYIGQGENDIHRLLDFDGYLHDAEFFAKKVTSIHASTGEPGERPLDLFTNPSFKVPFVGYDDGIIWLRDISLYDVNGTKVKDKSQAYVGIIVCRRSASVVPMANITNVTNSFNENVRELNVDTGLEIPRGDPGSGSHYVTVLACMVLSDRKVAQGSAVDSTNRGYYYPVLATRSNITFYVQPLEPQFSYDPVAPWQKDGNDVVLRWSAMPNGSMVMRGQRSSGETGMRLSITTNAGAEIWAACSFADDLPVTYVEDDEGRQLQLEYTARFEAQSKNCMLTVEALLSDGSPAFRYEFSAPIDDGGILWGDEFDESEAGNMATLEAVIGTDSLGWSQYTFTIIPNE